MSGKVRKKRASAEKSVKEKEEENGKSTGKERGENGSYFGCRITVQVFVQCISDFWPRPLCPVQLQATMSRSQCPVCAHVSSIYECVHSMLSVCKSWPLTIDL